MTHQDFAEALNKLCEEFHRSKPGRATLIVGMVVDDDDETTPCWVGQGERHHSCHAAAALLVFCVPGVLDRITGLVAQREGVTKEYVARNIQTLTKSFKMGGRS